MARYPGRFPRLFGRLDFYLDCQFALETHFVGASGIKLGETVIMNARRQPLTLAAFLIVLCSVLDFAGKAVPDEKLGRPNVLFLGWPIP